MDVLEDVDIFYKKFFFEQFVSKAHFLHIQKPYNVGNFRKIANFKLNSLLKKSKAN